MDFSQLAQNPFLSGGLLLMLAGGALYYLRRIPGLVYNFIERFCIVKMEILDEDESFHWMQVWLAEKLRDTLSISVVTRRNRPHDPNGEENAGEQGANQPTIYFIPAVGTYFFWYQGRFVTLNRDRRENGGGSSLLPGGEGKSMLRDKESFTLRIFSRKKHLARQLIEECRDKALPQDGKVDIRVVT